MSKEVEEAKEILKEYIVPCDICSHCIMKNRINNSIKILLNHIQELEQKDRNYIVQLTDEQYRKLVDNIRNEYKQKIQVKIEELNKYYNESSIETQIVFHTIHETVIKVLEKLKEE